MFTYVNNPDGTTTKQNNLERTFTQDYLDDYGDFLKEIYSPQSEAEIRASIYTPDVVSAQERATAIELEMNAIEADITNIDADVEAELA